MKYRTHTSWLRIVLVFEIAISAVAYSATNAVVTLSDDGSRGSLSQVIGASSSGDTVVFAVTGSITRAVELTIANDLVIAGPGASLLTIDGNHSGRIFKIASNATVQISGLTLSNGRAAAGQSGGAIHNAGTLTLSRCVITGNGVTASVGTAGGDGGGIYNIGQLVLSNTVVTANAAGNGGGGAWGAHYGGSGWSGGSGGGIASAGRLWMVDCIVSNNAAGYGGSGAYGELGGGAAGSGGSGGGIFALTSIVERCTIVSNWAGSGGTGGGSLFAASSGGSGSGGGGLCGGIFALTNCTILGNAAGSGGSGGMRYYFPGVPQGMASGGDGGHGGGILGGNSNEIVVACTITGNAAGHGGLGGNPPLYPNNGREGTGGGFLAYGTVQGAVLNNIIAQNSGTFADVAGTFEAARFNLVGMTNGANGFAGGSNIIGSAASPLDPKLASLANNGGPTPTIALLSNSPAIDASSASGYPATDQRGTSRPQGGGVDIGAYESFFNNPQIIAAAFSSGTSFTVQACGLPGRTYTLQCSTNLVNWFDVTNVTSGADGTCQASDGGAGGGRMRVYRLRGVQ